MFGVSLGLDDLQFAYHCIRLSALWIVTETINYFINNNSDVFCCMMDMSKAFNLVKWSDIFVELIDRGLSTTFIRLLLFMYVFQSVNVRWNNSFSEHFSITNGCKQGMVLSAIFYCCYCSGLFQLLEQQRSGCRVNSDYLGICGYSDDNLLPAPTLDNPWRPVRGNACH